MRTDALRILLPCLALLSACGSAPPQARNPLAEDAAEANAQGLKYYEHREYAAAADAFALALKLCQSLDDGACVASNRINLARTQLAVGSPEQAMRTLAPLNRGERAPDAAALTAQALLQTDRTQEADRLIDTARQQCAEACPAHASLSLLRARRLLQQGKADAAIQTLQAVLPALRTGQDRRETANALRLSAEAYLQLKDQAAAREAAGEALQIDRELGIPAKIAADLLLLGAAQDEAAARETYRRALNVAEAAELPTLADQARQALQSLPSAQAPNL